MMIKMMMRTTTMMMMIIDLVAQGLFLPLQVLFDNDNNNDDDDDNDDNNDDDDIDKFDKKLVPSYNAADIRPLFTLNRLPLLQTITLILMRMALLMMMMVGEDQKDKPLPRWLKKGKNSIKCASMTKTVVFNERKKPDKLGVGAREVCLKANLGKYDKVRNDKI